MKIKTNLALLILICISIIGILIYLNSNSKTLTNDEIKAKYCHVTAVVLKTDVYCQNPDLYRQHVQQNKVIEN